MKFAAFHISPIKEHAGGVCAPTPIANASFWTVYGYNEDGTVEALHDVPTQQNAVDIAQAMSPNHAIMQIVPERTPCVVNRPHATPLAYEVVGYAANAVTGEELPMADDRYVDFYGLTAVYPNEGYDIIAKHDTRSGSELLLRHVLRSKVDLPEDNLESDFTD